jgi:preprotein translocase subunit SecD
VVVFVFVYYKLSGLNAVVTLILNLLILLGALAYFDATLTLPGIAGVILTIGMGVDSNVLIFERIKEEVRAGKTVRTAISASFSKVFWTVFDSHLTSLIAAAILFQFGTGPVQGFAVTLSIGLIANMFTSIFVSRFLFDLIYGSRRQVESLSI